VQCRRHESFTSSRKSLSGQDPSAARLLVVKIRLVLLWKDCSLEDLIPYGEVKFSATILRPGYVRA